MKAMEKTRPSTSILKSLLGERRRRSVPVVCEIVNERLLFVFRRYTLSAFAFGLVLIFGAPAMPRRHLRASGANFKPVTIAVTPFAGEETATRSVAS